VRGLDTNVLLRVPVGDDPEQTRRIRAFLAALPPGERLFVNRIVVCELIWTLHRSFRFDREQIADVADRLLKSSLVVEDYDALGFALYLYRTRHTSPIACSGSPTAFAGCKRTATFDRRAAELDGFELI
jgi:predicted nucleic-acid-binding protein